MTPPDRPTADTPAHSPRTCRRRVLWVRARAQENRRSRDVSPLRYGLAAAPYRPPARAPRCAVAVERPVRIIRSVGAFTSTTSRSGRSIRRSTIVSGSPPPRRRPVQPQKIRCLGPRHVPEHGDVPGAVPAVRHRGRPLHADRIPPRCAPPRSAALRRLWARSTPLTRHSSGFAPFLYIPRACCGSTPRAVHAPDPTAHPQTEPSRGDGLCRVPTPLACLRGLPSIGRRCTAPPPRTDPLLAAPRALVPAPLPCPPVEADRARGRSSGRSSSCSRAGPRSTARR